MNDLCRKIQNGCNPCPLKKSLSRFKVFSVRKLLALGALVLCLCWTACRKSESASSNVVTWEGAVVPQRVNSESFVSNS